MALVPHGVLSLLLTRERMSAEAALLLAGAAVLLLRARQRGLGPPWAALAALAWLLVPRRTYVGLLRWMAAALAAAQH